MLDGRDRFRRDLHGYGEPSSISAFETYAKIVMSQLMPILDGENAARMIKSTKNANQNTPIVAVTSYAPRDQTSITEEGTVFNAVLTKPVNKTDILQVLTKLGFIAKTKHTNTTASGTAPVMTTTLSQSPSQALISQQT